MSGSSRQRRFGTSCRRCWRRRIGELGLHRGWCRASRHRRRGHPGARVRPGETPTLTQRCSTNAAIAVGAISSVGERLLDAEGTTGSVPVSPTKPGRGSGSCTRPGELAEGRLRAATSGVRTCSCHVLCRDGRTLLDAYRRPLACVCFAACAEVSNTHTGMRFDPVVWPRVGTDVVVDAVNPAAQ